MWASITQGQFVISSLSGRGMVETSQEVDVMLAEIKASDAYDRRWCFEILTTQQVLLVFQAESEDALKDWIMAFQNSRMNALVEEKATITVDVRGEASPRGIVRSDSMTRRMGEGEERAVLMRRFPQLRGMNDELAVLVRGHQGK